VLRRIEVPAKRWFYACAKMQGSQDERPRMWESCYDYFVNPANHFDLTVAGKRQLRWFVTDVAGLLGKVQSSFSTQLNENFIP
jgi:hypothetical protein